MATKYTLIRSARKSVGIQVTRDLEVIVRAPGRMPRRDIDAVVARYARWVDEHIELQRQRAAQAPPEPTPQEEAQYRAQAKTYLPQRVAHYAALMGVTPTGVKVTSARKRHGSCSGRNSLCFSWRLMRYPQAAIDYVVVHELAHIVHKNHSPAFYALIAQYMPDWKARRALLRDG